MITQEEKKDIILSPDKVAGCLYYTGESSCQMRTKNQGLVLLFSQFDCTPNWKSFDVKELEATMNALNTRQY